MADQVDALVIFGATGDLAKLETFPALVGLVQRGVLNVPVVGVAKSGWGLEQFRDYAVASLRLNNMDPATPAAQKMLNLLRYVDGDLGDEGTYKAMSDAAGPGGELLYYLEVPPVLFGRIAEGIAGAGRAECARVMVEKPFGTDLASSRALNETMHKYFPEDAIFRVDDWLAFDPVENVLFVRFANSVLEPLLTAPTWRASRSRWPRRSTCPTAAGSTTGPARSGTWCRTTCSRSWPRCWPSRLPGGPGWSRGRPPRRG